MDLNKETFRILKMLFDSIAVFLQILCPVWLKLNKNAFFLIKNSLQRGKASLVLEKIGSENMKNKGCRDDLESYALGDGLASFGKELK